MTLEELRSANINPLVAREAHEQATKRLADVLETKKAYEQKAFALFSGFLTVTLGFIAGGVALTKDGAIGGMALALWVAGVVSGVGALFLMLALLDKAYGAVASDPKMWLLRDIIDGPDERLALMLAYVTYYHQERIDKSVEANAGKAIWIRRAIVAGFLTPIALIASILVEAKSSVRAPSSASHASQAAPRAAAVATKGTVSQTNAASHGSMFGSRSAATNQIATNSEGRAP